MRLDGVKADMQRRDGPTVVTKIDPRFAAPWQEFRITLDILDEIEHLLRRTLDQYRFFNKGHSRPRPSNPVESAILASSPRDPTETHHEHHQ